MANKKNRLIKLRSIFMCILFFFCQQLFSQNFITGKNAPGSFPIVSQTATPIYSDKNDDWLVQKAVSLFQNDMEMVSGKKTGNRQ